MTDRLPLVNIAGERKELPSADTISQAKINGLVADLALKATIDSPVFTTALTSEGNVTLGPTPDSTQKFLSLSMRDLGAGVSAIKGSELTITGGKGQDNTTGGGGAIGGIGGDVKIIAGQGGTSNGSDASARPNGGDVIISGGPKGTGGTFAEGEDGNIILDGKVGVGNTAPAVDLDVTGKIRASTGILFGADTAAANALDDYEEGTWTPTVIAHIGGVPTYFIQAGRFTKVGNMVTAWCSITFSKNTLSGELQIGGLPFTVANVVTYATGNVTMDELATQQYIGCQGNVNTAQVILLTDLGGTGPLAGLNVTDLNSNNQTTRFTLSYEVA